MGIKNLKGKVANNLWDQSSSKSLPRSLWRRARLLLEIMNSSSSLQNLKIKGSPPDVRLHKLKGDLNGFWSVTIEKKSGWRIIFRYEKEEICDVQVVDYHEG